MRFTTVAVIVLACGLMTSSAAPAQSPDSDELMRRVAAYVQTFVDAFGNVVAEERYEQRLGSQRRQLASDFLLVAYPGRADRVLTFRDVREVDGKTVKDQSDRITQLFLNPFDSAIGRATEIQLEGLRHSLRGGRLANPLTILTLLQREYQKEYRFTRQGLDRSLGSDIRRIDLIRLRPPLSSQPRGSVWVSENTGEVVRTIRIAGSERTTTTFAVDRELGIRVPVRMEDEAGDFRGSAAYGNFRRFNVRTESTIDSPDSTSPR